MAKNCTYTINGLTLSESELKNYLLQNTNLFKAAPAPIVEEVAATPVRQSASVKPTKKGLQKAYNDYRKQLEAVVKRIDTGDASAETQEEFDRLSELTGQASAELEAFENANPAAPTTPTEKATTTKPTSKKELIQALQDIFNLPKEQAKAIGEVVDSAATGMLNMGIYKKRDEYYASLPSLTSEAPTGNVLNQTITRNNTTSVLSPTSTDEFIRYDVMKDGKQIGSYEIEQLNGTEAKISFFKSDIQGFGYGEQIFLEGTNAIIKMGLTPVIDNFITGYGYSAMQKLADKGYLVQLLPQSLPTAKPTMQIEYPTAPFVYNESNLLFQIVGERGANALDTNEENTFRLDNLEVAKILRESGVPNVSVWRATGWQLGAEGKWRYEIPYGQFKKDWSLNFFDTATVTLEEIFDAPELFNAYSELRKIPITLNVADRNSFFEIKNNGRYAISIGTNGRKENTAALRRSLIHEIQHAIQEIEGFAKGGMGTDSRYLRLAGEVESRNAERRSNYDSIDSRLFAPSTTQDVEADSLILNQQSKAAIDTQNRIMYALTNPDVSSPLHEFSHLWLADIQRAADNGNQQALALIERVNAFAESEEGRKFFAKHYQGETFDLNHSSFKQELFARGFERWIAEGIAPKGNSTIKQIFQKFKEWLIDIYNGITGSVIDIQLSDKMNYVYEQLLGMDTVQRKKQMAEAQKQQQDLDEISDMANVGLDLLGKKDLVKYVNGLIAKMNTNELTPNDKEAQRLVFDTHAAFLANKNIDLIEDDDMADMADRLEEFLAEAKTIHGNINQSQAKEKQEKTNAKQDAQEVFLDADSLEERRKESERIRLQQEDEQKRRAVIAPIVPMTVASNRYVPTIKMGRDMVLLEPEAKNDEYNGWKVGDRVEYNGKKYYIKFIGKSRDEATKTIGTRAHLIEERYIRVSEGRPFISSQSKAEVTYVLFSEDSLTKLEIPKGDTLSEDVPQRETTMTDIVLNVIERMERMFPSIKFEINNYDWPQFGRFYQGKVQINKNNLREDTPIHEVMHPFVRAISISNPVLYRQLLADLDTRVANDAAIQYMRDDIARDPTYAGLRDRQRTEELLVRVLTDDMTGVFRVDGTVNPEELAKKSKSFKDYLNEFFNLLLDLIRGNRVNRELDNFINSMNADVNLKDKYKFEEDLERPDGGRIRTVETVELGNKTIILINRDFYTNTATPQNLFYQLQEDLSEEEYTKVVNAAKKKNIMSKQTSTSKSERKFLTASDLPINMTIEQLSYLILQDEVQFQFTTAEQRAIDEIEAYSSSSKADTIKKLQDRIRNLRDTGTRRIVNDKGSSLINEAAYQESVLRDTDEDMAILNYIRTAHVSLQNAVGRMNKMRSDIGKIKETRELNNKEILKFNSEFREITTLYQFYLNAETSVPVGMLVKQNEDLFTKGQTKTAAKKEMREIQDTINTVEGQKSQFKSMLIELSVDLIFPQYLNKMQLVLNRNPNSKHIAIPTINNGTQLDVEKLKQDLKNSFYSSSEDASLPSYLLGAAINSKDPVTAMITLMMNDALYQNIVAEDALIELTRHQYYQFLKDKGVANNEKAQRQWFKDNYMRKALVWEKTGYDEVKREPIWEKVERWAYHEDKFYDQIALKVREYVEKQPKATTAQEYHDMRNRITAYEKAISADPQYINPKFASLSADTFYNHLYTNYKNLNKYFGANALRYGILPQIHSQPSLTKAGKNIFNAFKKEKDKLAAEKTVKGKVSTALDDATRSIFGRKDQFDSAELNFDNTIFRNVRTSSLNPIENEEELEMLLHESLILFAKDAFHYSAFKELQPAIENMRLVINGNAALGISPREILQSSNHGKNLKWYKNIKLPKRKEHHAKRLTKQLNSQIDDIMYGVSEEELTILNGRVSLNKVADNLGFFTALSGMMGNLFAATRNIGTGNVINYGEAVSGRYYNAANYRAGVKEYFAQTFSPKNGLMSDLYGKEKSKLAQLALVYDAVQGEYRSNRRLITGGITRSLYDRSNFFILSRMGEHQIQLTHMIALMKATQVETNKGEKIDLYSAYEKDKNGVFSIRKDVKWSKQDDNNFRDLLHSTGRELNGNYSPNHKAILQRNLLGKQLMIFKKYLYYQTRSRWGAAKINYERGDLEYGYYRMFMKGIKDMFTEKNFDAIKMLWNKSIREKDPQMAAAVRKTVYEMALILTLFALVKGIDADDDDYWALQGSVFLGGIYGDIAGYSVNAFSEAERLIKTPAASENNLIKLTSFGSQAIQDLINRETALYEQSGAGYEEGDSKLGSKFKKLIPLYNKYESFFEHPENYLKYQSLVGRKISGEKDN